MGHESDAEPAGVQARVFINYRREDSDAAALLLYERLADRYGAESVFLDIKSLQPGVKWLDEIKAHATAGVFLSLIGTRWLSTMKARKEAGVADPAEDYVRFEIEYALRHRPDLTVIPVLIGDAAALVNDVLPKSLQALTQIEMEQVHLRSIDDDARRLADRIDAITRDWKPAEPAPPPQEPETPPSGAGTEAPPDTPGDERRPSSTVNAIAPRPDSAHFREIVQYMLDEGSLVPVLGARMADRRHGGQSLIEAAGSLPDSEELAAGLAERFKLEPKEFDLAQVAQYVYVTRGRPDLFKTLKQMLTADCEPGAVHQFLARFPKLLRRLDLTERYQMIITTNFDAALEQAFDAEDEGYDLAVYMASGEDQGHFVHFPYEGDPVPIPQPNRYGGFPIGDYGELERTLIVKIHGAVDGNRGDYRWKENYVITEDHYIDYLSVKPIGDVVPVQILENLRDSHCLFLGYAMRDWNLRVFLKRIWLGQPVATKSWAVETAPDMLEKEFWTHFNVDLYATDLGDYVTRLSKALETRAPIGANP